MRRLVPALLVSVIMTGCSVNPFPEVELVSLEGVEPATVLQRFREGMPERFRALSSLVLEFPGKAVSALGVAEVDLRRGTFTALAMNPMGVKLFEITGDSGRVTSSFMIPAMSERGDAAAAIGEDIRRIYFDLVPPEGAVVERERYRVLFRERSGAGTIEYTYGGTEGVMLQKRYLEDEETVWKVSYHEHVRRDGKSCPRGIVLNNYRYGYRVVIRVKEMTL